MSGREADMGWSWRALALVTAALLVVWEPTESRAGLATDQVKGTVDQVIKILTDPALKGEKKLRERRAKIRQVVLQRFGFTEMSKRSLGRYWNERTPAERTEFVRLYTDLLERAYIDRVDGYTGEQVVYQGESVDGDYSEVKSKIVTKRNQEIPILYRLQKTNANWEVYDVIVEGVSLVNNYRTQFSKIIRTSSYEGLVKKMQVKLEGEEAGELGAPKPKVR
ncbi:MAG: ABC transporter substrate-binding protein [candidate division NC10 bacterium]|nr:ABC transporter substrate-binding protein [candidate division NC10 bacterium]